MNKQAINKICDLIIESERLDQNQQYDEAIDLLIAICEGLDKMTKTSGVAKDIGNLAKDVLKTTLDKTDPKTFWGNAWHDLWGKVPRGTFGRGLKNVDELNNLAKAVDETEVLKGIAQMLGKTETDPAVVNIFNRIKSADLNQALGEKLFDGNGTSISPLVEKYGLKPNSSNLIDVLSKEKNPAIILEQLKNAGVTPSELNLNTGTMRPLTKLKWYGAGGAMAHGAINGGINPMSEDPSRGPVIAPQEPIAPPIAPPITPVTGPQAPSQSYLPSKNPFGGGSAYR